MTLSEVMTLHSYLHVLYLYIYRLLIFSVDLMAWSTRMQTKLIQTLTKAILMYQSYKSKNAYNADSSRVIFRIDSKRRIESIVLIFYTTQSSHTNVRHNTYDRERN